MPAPHVRRLSSEPCPSPVLSFVRFGLAESDPDNTIHAEFHFFGIPLQVLCGGRLTPLRRNRTAKAGLQGRRTCTPRFPATPPPLPRWWCNREPCATGR